MNITFLPLPRFDGLEYCIFCHSLETVTSVNISDLFGGMVCAECRQGIRDTFNGKKYAATLAIHTRERRRRENFKTPLKPQLQGKDYPV